MYIKKKRFLRAESSPHRHNKLRANEMRCAVYRTFTSPQASITTTINTTTTTASPSSGGRAGIRAPCRARAKATTSSEMMSADDDVSAAESDDEEEGMRSRRVIPQKYLVGEEEEALAALIATGTVDVHARAEHSGKSPIHLAAWRGSIATVQVLLDAAR